MADTTFRRRPFDPYPRWWLVLVRSWYVWILVDVAVFDRYTRNGDWGYLFVLWDVVLVTGVELLIRSRRRKVDQDAWAGIEKSTDPVAAAAVHERLFSLSLRDQKRVLDWAEANGGTFNMGEPLPDDAPKPVRELYDFIGALHDPTRPPDEPPPMGAGR